MKEPRDFGAEVLSLIGTIPAGKVLTYGDVAAMLGSRAARRVGAVLATEVKDEPWWRVVSAQGTLPVHLWDEALTMYGDEGTALLRTPERDDLLRVDLRRARWLP